MDEAPRRKIRIGEAAAAIGASIVAVRNWYDRYADKVKTNAEQSGVWLEFDWVDVATLAITKPLIELGYHAHEAYPLASAVVHFRWPGLYEAEPNWLPHSEPLSKGLLVFFRSKDGAWTSSDLAGEVLGNTDVRNLPDVSADSRVVVSILVTEIISDAFKALRDMGHAPPGMDAPPPRVAPRRGRPPRFTLSEQGK
jgi:hypothetical protein